MSDVPYQTYRPDRAEDLAHAEQEWRAAVKRAIGAGTSFYGRTMVVAVGLWVCWTEVSGGWRGFAVAIAPAYVASKAWSGFREFRAASREADAKWAEYEAAEAADAIAESEVADHA